MEEASIFARVLSVPYAAALRLRAFLYAKGIFGASSLARPVISVGNLTFGGTGKTPFVAWLSKALQVRGLRPGVLSRGYGGTGGENDEAKMLAAMLPQLAHVQNPDRVAGGAALVAGGVDVVILDDGFQHLRLRRDLDVLLVDATDPFGGGACPPGGRLREPLRASARADLIVLTRADLLNAPEREQVWGHLERVRAGRPRIELAFAVTGLLETATNRHIAIPSLGARQVALLSAIGNPAAFRRTAENVGFSVQREFRFRDHHRYTQQELAKVYEQASGTPVLTTWKDWVKIRDFPEFRPWVLEITPKFLRGEESLQKRLDGLFSARANR